MKGSVRKRYNNAWSYRIDLGFVDGKRKQVEKGGFKTEREATKAMQDVLYHLNNTGDYVENNSRYALSCLIRLYYLAFYMKSKTFCPFCFYLVLSCDSQMG